MPRSFSVGEMIQQIIVEQMNKPASFNNWEHGFIDNIAGITGSGKQTANLSINQVDKIAQIWEKKIGGDPH